MTAQTIDSIPVKFFNLFLKIFYYCEVNNGSFLRQQSIIGVRQGRQNDVRQSEYRGVSVPNTICQSLINAQECYLKYCFRLNSMSLKGMRHRKRESARKNAQRCKQTNDH